jgi:hypothetical protein
MQTKTNCGNPYLQEIEIIKKGILMNYEMDSLNVGKDAFILKANWDHQMSELFYAI